MTSASINSFVGDLVAMAQAQEELPRVKEALTASEAECNKLAQTVADRESSIIVYKQEIESLLTKVRSLEVERDEAMFRELEAQEKVQGALNTFRVMASDIGQVIMVLDPPKPEPIPEVVNDPIPSPMSAPQAMSAEADQGSMYELVREQGQSEPLPTVNTPDLNTDHVDPVTLPANDQVVGSTQTEHSAADAAPQPDTPQPLTATHTTYLGWDYKNYPRYVTRSDWIAGTGDAESYDAFYRDVHGAVRSNAGF